MFRFVTVALATASLTASQGATQQTQIFKSTTETVPVFVTVTDRSGRLVPDLRREDFQVFDNGKPQPITLFDNTPQPIRLIALIDLSGSMGNNLPLIRRACTELVARLLPNDLARVGTFAEEIAFSPSFTLDTSELLSLLPSRIPIDAPTPLWRATGLALTELAAAPAGRRVILILSDGKDSGAQFPHRFVSSLEISERAQREDVMIYGLGLRSAPGPISDGGIVPLSAVLSATIPDPQLGNVAIDTGGGYLELRPRDDLSQTLARVADELHRQYLIGFAPPVRDGKTHKIEVRLRDGSMKPTARKTYLAPKS